MRGNIGVQKGNQNIVRLSSLKKIAKLVVRRVIAVIGIISIPVVTFHWSYFLLAKKMKKKFSLLLYMVQRTMLHFPPEITKICVVYIIREYLPNWHY